MRHLLVGIVLITCSLPVHGSTPTAWSKLERDAKRSCIAASNFRQPRASEMIVFSDAVGQVALLVTGIYRQPHMKGVRGTNLCLYNRRTRASAVEEAMTWGELRSRELPRGD